MSRLVEELRDAHRCLSQKAKEQGRCFGSRALGTGSRGPHFSSSSAQTIGEGHWYPSFPFLAWAPCLRGGGQRLPSSAGQPEGPTSGPAGQSLLHAGLSPADASPRLWPEPRPEHSPRHRCSHSLALDKLLGKITEPAFLNPPLSGEKRGPSLLRPPAPGCPPRGPAAGCRSMRPLSVPLAPVLRFL